MVITDFFQSPEFTFNRFSVSEQVGNLDIQGLVVFCGNEVYFQIIDFADIDLTIAMDHLILAATVEGLGTCWVGAFDVLKVKEI